MIIFFKIIVVIEGVQILRGNHGCSSLVVAVVSEGVDVAAEAALEDVLGLDLDALGALADLVTDLGAVVADVVLRLFLGQLFKKSLGAIKVLVHEDLRVVVRALGSLLAVAVHVVPAELPNDVFEFTCFTKKTKSHIKVGAALVDVPIGTMLTSFAFVLHEIRAYLKVVTEIALVSVTTGPHCFELIAGFNLALVVGVRAVLPQPALTMDEFLTDPVGGQLVVVGNGRRHLRVGRAFIEVIVGTRVGLMLLPGVPRWRVIVHQKYNSFNLRVCAPNSSEFRQQLMYICIWPTNFAVTTLHGLRSCCLIKQQQQIMRLHSDKTSTKRSTGIAIAISLVLAATMTVYLLSEGSQSVLTESIRALYTTNSSRLDTVSQYCTTSQAIEQSDRDLSKQYNSAMSTYFKANSTELVTSLVNGDTGGVTKQIQINGAGTIVFIIPFIIGLAVTALIWPCLLCCCVCPDSCPPQCCRNKNPNYSHGQLVCPTVFVILLSVIMAATTVPAMTSSKPFFQLFNCELSTFIDNFLHGNHTSSEQHFFSGVTMVRSQLTDVLSPKLTQVDTHVSKLKATASSVMQTAQNHASSALTSMQTLPDGTTTAALNLNYNYPIESSSSTSTLASSVAAQIDTYTNSTSLLGTLYDFVNTLRTNLTDISTAATTVSPHLNAAGMGTQITAADTVLASVQDNLDSINDKLKSVMSLLASIDSFTSSYQLALYGVILGVALLILTGIIFIKCLGMMKCRYFLYALCVIALFLCLITFLLTVILALLTPSLYYTCDYFDGRFDSPSAFRSMMTTLQGSEYDTLVNNFAECFGGTYDFMTVLNPTLSSYITQLQVAVHNSKQYDFTAMTTDMNTNVNNLGTAIDNAGLGDVPDFDTTTTQGSAQISYFNQVAQKSLYTSSCPSATYSVFYTDVWVPGVSTTYQSYVSCRDRVSIDNSTCVNGIDNTVTCPTSRCINTFSIISDYYREGTIATLTSDSDTRYGGACTDFTNYLNNFYTNYAKVVDDNIGNSNVDSANNAKLAGRFNSQAQTPCNTLRDYMNNDVNTLFNNVYDNLTQVQGLTSVFDPTTGLFTGLDCRLLQEQANNAIDSMCVLTVNRVYFSLVTSGIMAFALLFLLCCLVCFNVRHLQEQSAVVNKRRVMPIQDEDSTDSIKMG